VTITQRIAFGAAASWLSRGVSILLGVAVMPVLFRHLPKEELGAWLLLGQSWAALGIFDLGFGVTLTRRIAFAKSKSGVAPSAPLSQESLRELANLIATGRCVYRGLAVFALLFSFGAGCFYFRTLDLHSVALSRVWLTWGILCLSQAAGVWAAVWNCVLQGVGYVGWDAVLASMVNVIVLSGQIAAACCGGGLTALATVAAGGALLQRCLLLAFAKRRRRDVFVAGGQWNGQAFRSMVSPALRAWVTSLGLVLAGQTDAFFIATWRGTSEVPAYRAAFLMCANLNMLAVTVAGASSAFLSQMWLAGELELLRRTALRNATLGLAFMACGLGLLLGTGRWFFGHWLGEGQFVGYPVLAAFCAGQFLEVQAHVLSTSSRATEDEAFALSSICGGLLKLCFAGMLIGRLGLFGLALSTVMAMGSTNYWYMAWRALGRLGIAPGAYLKSVLLPSLGLFALSFAGASAAITLLREANPWARTGLAATLIAAAFLVAAWLWLLTPAQNVSKLQEPT
jgi:O-antigen/teichoic acid export membrane protein